VAVLLEGHLLVALEDHRGDRAQLGGIGIEARAGGDVDERPSEIEIVRIVVNGRCSGVLVIVLNYVGLIPGTDGQADPIYLWVGLGLIGVGFVGTTFWY